MWARPSPLFVRPLSQISPSIKPSLTLPFLQLGKNSSSLSVFFFLWRKDLAFVLLAFSHGCNKTPNKSNSVGRWVQLEYIIYNTWINWFLKTRLGTQPNTTQNKRFILTNSVRVQPTVVGKSRQQGLTSGSREQQTLAHSLLYPCVSPPFLPKE